MLKIGLTGGIGSGKSLVANFFQDLDVEIIDSDLITRELLQPNTSAYDEVIKRYSEDILVENAQIDRKKLRKIIFASQEDKLWLEKLLHPLVKDEIAKKLKKSFSPYTIIVIPLLVETQYYDLIDRILLVDASIENQIERTKKRDNISDEQVKRIIDTQATRQERLAVADDIIYNDGDLEHLHEQIRQKHAFYLSLVER